MRNLRPSAFCAILALVGLTFFPSSNQNVRAVSMHINIKDLPEHGLKLIPPTDPSFRAMLSPLRRAKSDPLAEALMPYSVLLANEGRKAIVGYRLKWEMIGPDGVVTVRQAGGANPEALMEEASLGAEHSSLNGGFAVKPNSTVFVSLAGSLGGDYGSGISGYSSGSTDPTALDDLRRTAKKKHLPSIEDAVAADLQKYKSMTISVDGVVFEDGTFVGPDTTGFFATVQSYVNARRDLQQEIAFAVGHNKSVDEIFGYVEELANAPFPNKKLSPADMYDVYKKTLAQEMLQMRTASSPQQAVEFQLRQFRKKGPKLRKL
jgi:hypothetical protein